MGGEPWQLIEPVDGFHPSQVKTQAQKMGRSRWDVETMWDAGERGILMPIAAQASSWHATGMQIKGMSILKERES